MEVDKDHLRPDSQNSDRDKITNILAKYGLSYRTGGIILGASGDDLKKILSGLSSVVDGLGSLRTHRGSAHGQGRKPYKIESRHARLAIRSAHSLCIFVLETWDKKKSAPTTS